MCATQDIFARALLDPNATRPTGLSDGKGRAAKRRYDVYRNNVTVSLMEALDVAFPIVRKLLGEQNFSVLARSYVRKNPPTSPMLMFYGATLPEFLESFEPVKQIGYLPDIARLEVAIRESYHAADAAALDPAVLAALTPDEVMRARFRFVPAARLVRSKWPIHAIWKVNTDPSAPKPVMAAQDVLILRPEFDPEFFLLPQGAGCFAEALMEKSTLSEAAERATQHMPDFDLTQSLSVLISNGAFHSLGDKS